MKLCIELFGAPRIKAGAPKVVLELPDQPSLGDLVGALAFRYPGLVGKVIKSERHALEEPYVFYVEGVGFATDMTTRLKEGIKVALMTSQVGG